MKLEHSLIGLLLLLSIILLLRMLPRPEELPAREEISDSPDEEITFASLSQKRNEPDDGANSQMFAPFEDYYECSVKPVPLDADSLPTDSAGSLIPGPGTVDVVCLDLAEKDIWIEKDLLSDLSPCARFWTDRTFAPFLEKQSVHRGKLFLLPADPEVWLLCIRREALRMLPERCDPDDLTWEETALWAERLAESEGKGVFLLAAGEPRILVPQVVSVILAHGGGYPDISSPQAVRAWETLLRLSAAFVSDPREYTRPLSSMEGTGAMLTIASNRMIARMPEEEMKKYRFANLPKGPSGSGSAVHAHGLAIMRSAPNPHRAADLLTFLTAPESQARFARMPRTQDPTVLEARKYLKEEQADRRARLVLKTLENSRLCLLPERLDAKSEELLFAAFVSTVLENKSVDKALLGRLQSALPKPSRAMRPLQSTD